jgi:CRP-like cAMP-binding protein
MKVLARRLQDTNNVLAASSFLAANGRVAGALLSIAEAFGKEVGNGRIRREQRLTFGDCAQAFVAGPAVFPLYFQPAVSSE